MSETPLAKRLQIKPGYRICVLNAPEGSMQRLLPLPAGVQIVDDLAIQHLLDFVQLFVLTKTVLERDIAAALNALKQDGLLWIAYPKRSSKVQTDITRDSGWEVIAQAGLTAVTQISVDDVWSALRFRPIDKVGE